MLRLQLREPYVAPIAAMAMGRDGFVRVGISAADALLIWPSDVRAYAHRVNRAIQALNADILEWAKTKGSVKDYGKLGDREIVVVKLDDPADRSFYQAWDEWYGEWIHNYIDIENDSMIAPGAVITRWEEIERRETDYRKWRVKFTAIGGIAGGADIASEEEIKKEHTSGSDVPWTGILIVAGLIAAAIALASIAPALITKV